MSNPFLNNYEPRPSHHVPSENIGFVFTQDTPSDTWTIAHNLGLNPAVELMTVGGVEFEADVVHLNENVCRVYLAKPMAGKARCI